MTAKMKPKALLLYSAGVLEVKCPTRVAHPGVASYDPALRTWSEKRGYSHGFRAGDELTCPTCGTVYRLPNDREAKRHLDARRKAHRSCP